MAIYFYKVNNEYGSFSNFAHFPFELEDKIWITSEHYFQAQKFTDDEYKEKIRLSDSPMEAANLGRSHDIPLRNDWEKIKDNVMRKAVFAKFTQNKELQLLLLQTEGEVLIEKTSDDYYWGCGKDGSGKNMLGKILMELREALRNE